MQPVERDSVLEIDEDPVEHEDLRDQDPSSFRPEISILIHVEEAAADISLLVESYNRVLGQLHRTGEIIFVIDGPGGVVLDRISEVQTRHDNIKVLALQGGGNGESIAFSAGIEHAAGRFVFTAGDYLQVAPEEIGIHLAALEGGADLVLSWRSPRVDPWLNRLQSKFFNWFLRRVSKVPLHDLNCGFRSMRREVLEEISVYGDLFRFLPIMAKRRGFSVKEVKVRHLEEKGKTGFFGIGVYLRRLLDILAVTFLTRFTQKPLRFFGIIGAAMIVIGMALALPPFIERITGIGGLQDRPIFLMGVVLLAFGFQCIGFGLVGEIIIFTQSRNLKEYKIDQITSPHAREAEIPVETVDLPPIQGHAPPATVGAGSSPPSIEERQASIAPAREVRPRDTDLPPLVRRVAPGEETVLDLYVTGHEHGTIFHLDCWRRMVEEVMGRSAIVLVAEKGGRIAGILPFFHLKSMFLGKVAVSMPFAVYGGVLADDEDVAEALIQAGNHISDAAGNRYFEYRHVESVGDQLAERELYVTYKRELPEDPERCLLAIPRKARAEARKARDHGLIFEEGCELSTFHRLFAENKQSLGSPVIPLKMLQSIEKELGMERLVMHQVRDPESGKIIAAVMSFLYGDQILPYYSGGLDGFERLGVNNFMYWKLMEWASQKGIKVFDFGRSRKDTGSARFKKNMGFEAQSLAYQYHLGPGGSLPDLHPGNPKIGIYQKVWRRLPRSLAISIGGPIFKQLA